MTAVAVWDRLPSDDALLATRLADGWRPTPTALREGPQVLGYAACAVPDAGVVAAGFTSGGENDLLRG